MVRTQSVSGHVSLLERALLRHFAHFLEVQSDIVLQEVLVNSTEVVVGASDVVELEESVQVNVAVFVIIVGFDDLGYAIIEGSARSACGTSDELGNLNFAH